MIPTGHHSTGFDSTTWRLQIPTGWAEVTRFIRNGDDVDARAYVGPVLEENDIAIRIEVYNEPMTFDKDHCIITRPYARINRPAAATEGEPHA